MSAKEKGKAGLGGQKGGLTVDKMVRKWTPPTSPPILSTPPFSSLLVYFLPPLLWISYILVSDSDPDRMTAWHWPWPSNFCTCHPWYMIHTPPISLYSNFLLKYLIYTFWVYTNLNTRPKRKKRKIMLIKTLLSFLSNINGFFSSLVFFYSFLFI